MFAASCLPAVVACAVIRPIQLSPASCWFFLRSSPVDLHKKQNRTRLKYDLTHYNAKHNILTCVFKKQQTATISNKQRRNGNYNNFNKQ
jgi:hypothetical protein